MVVRGTSETHPRPCKCRTVAASLDQLADARRRAVWLYFLGFAAVTVGRLGLPQLVEDNDTGSHDGEENGRTRVPLGLRLA